MRAPRALELRAALVVELLRQHGVLTDGQLAVLLRCSKSTARAARRAALEEGQIVLVPNPPGSHYPIAGWRALREGESPPGFEGEQLRLFL